MTTPSLNLTACQFRQVRWSLPAIPCDRCQRLAPRVDDAARSAVDIALDQPVLVEVIVSVHRCRPCQPTFRAQPPFLRKGAISSTRVVNTAIASVVEDGMAFRRVVRRLARDFWVPPSAAMIRQWHRAAADGLDFTGDYLPWVVREFSGVLCVDKVSQDQIALLLAVDPAAPDGDRLVGYQLVQGAVDQQEMADFLGRLRQAGIAPARVITDGSPLDPSTIAAVWPQAAHQRCLFHQTRHVTKAVREVLKAVRAELPVVPPGVREATAPSAAPSSPPTGEAVADHAVANTSATPRRRGRGRCPQEVRQAGLALVHALRRQGGSVQGIARQTGISRPTVRGWLGQPDPGVGVGAAGELPVVVQRLDMVDPPPPPPAPWDGWEQGKPGAPGVGVDRFRLCCRPDHLMVEDHAAFATLFASPVGPTLRLARAFVEDWYAIWQDASGARRSLSEARQRYEEWQTDQAYATAPALQKIQRQIDATQFTHLSHFLQEPGWEATNNGAERGGRAFRHRQAPHFNRRGTWTIEQALKAEAFRRKATATASPTVLPARSARGRQQARTAAIG